MNIGMPDFIKTVFNYIKQSELLKVVSLTGIATVIKFITGFFSLKAIAILIGPDGVALVGQAVNFSTILLTISTGGITFGIVKLIADNSDNPERLNKIIETSITFVLVCSIIAGFIVIFLSDYLSEKFFNDVQYNYVFIIFGSTLIFYSLNITILGVLNGLRKYREFVWVNISNSIFGLIITILFVYFFGLGGALVSAISYQSFAFVITFIIIRRNNEIRIKFISYIYNIKILKQLLSYSLMSLTSAIVIPTSQIIVRSLAMEKFSAVEAGYWEAINRFSVLSMGFFTTTLGVYYLPALSKTKDNIELKSVIISTSRIILPMVLVFLSITFIARDLVIELLYSKDFYPMKSLFVWQLSGDFIRIAAWMLSFIFLAKTMTKQFVITELIFPIIFVLNSIILMNLTNSIEGISQAYLINKILYLITMILLFKKTLWNSTNGLS
ncbi:MAG: O-antigen translocase [Brumimicrobium sp.]|nr:O-antigen translocase [Brumimicrobium sp.]